MTTVHVYHSAPNPLNHLSCAPELELWSVKCLWEEALTSARLLCLRKQLKELEEAGMLRGQLSSEQQLALLSGHDNLAEALEGAFFVQVTLTRSQSLLCLIAIHLPRTEEGLPLSASADCASSARGSALEVFNLRFFLFIFFPQMTATLALIFSHFAVFVPSCFLFLCRNVSLRTWESSRTSSRKLRSLRGQT